MGLFAEITVEHVVSFSSIIVTLGAAIAWLSKSVIPKLLESYRSDLAAAHISCAVERKQTAEDTAADRKIIADAHAVEIAKRDDLLAKLTEIINKVADKINKLPSVVIEKVATKIAPK